jgi:hypothetical protein
MAGKAYYALLVNGTETGIAYADAHHNLLSAYHGDSNAAAVVKGAFVYGNATPKWDAFAPNSTATKKWLNMTSSVPSWDAIVQADCGGLTITDSPTFNRLYINPGAGSGGYIFFNAESSSFASMVFQSAGVNKWFVQRTTTDDLGFYDGVVGVYAIYLRSGGGVFVGATAAIGSELLRVDGNAYFDHDVSALTFTDRTPYPKNKKEAYDAVKSYRKKADKDELDHDNLTTFVKSGTDGRNLSATVSALCEMMKDLDKRIENLEKK